jgi:hypothetical protein
MQVKDRLTGTCAGIDNSAIATLAVTLLVSHFGADTKQVTKHCLISLRRFIKGFEMLARDYQHMHRRLRINVTDYYTAFVLVHNFAVDFSIDNLAKQATLFRHALSAP